MLIGIMKEVTKIEKKWWILKIHFSYLKNRVPTLFYCPPNLNKVI